MLHIAVQSGSLPMVDLILKKGGTDDMSAITKFNKATALHYAVELGYFEIVKLLVSTEKTLKNSDNDSMSVQDHMKLFPLSLAATKGFLDIAKYLIDNGADIHAVPEKDKSNILHHAAMSNNIEIFQFFLSKVNDRADEYLCAQDCAKETPIHVAVQHGSAGIIKFLMRLHGADLHPNKFWGDYKVQLFRIVSSGSVETMKIVLDNSLNKNSLDTDIVNFNLLSEAIVGTLSYEMIKFLLDNGAKKYINNLNDDGFAPLHLASALKECNKIVQLLLLKGADINFRHSNDGRNALHIAADAGNYEVVKTLLEQDKTLLNTTDNNGNTALHLAAGEKHFEVAELLFQQKAELRLLNNSGRTPLMTAIYRLCTPIAHLLNITENDRAIAK